jgi:hypothetical protein
MMKASEMEILIPGDKKNEGLGDYSLRGCNIDETPKKCDLASNRVD